MQPPGKIRGTALLAHCFTCTQASLAATRISRGLAENGLAVLRFDFTGLGKSAGEFSESGFARNVEDLLAAAAYLEREIAPLAVLLGHSLGGAAAIVAAARLPDLKALVTLGAPSDAAHVLANIEGDLAEIERTGSGEVSIGGRPFRISADFLAQARQADVLGAIEQLRMPLLICHSPLDRVVSIDNAGRIFQSAMHPKSFLSLEDADHLLTNAQDARWIADVVTAWSARHLGHECDDASPNSGKTVAISDGPGFPVDLTSGHHRWRADEPKSFGGTDTGPTPYDLLLGALGACTAMTIRMVAEREKIPLDTVKVTLDHAHNHQVDCDHCDGEGGRIEAITRMVTINGAMSDKQRERLLTVANRCPVHKTLTGSVHIHDNSEDA